MRTKLMTCAIAATAILTLAACGGDDDDNASSGTTEGSGSATTAESGGVGDNSVVATGDTDLGEVLTTADGLTLYAFSPDEGGTPTCEGECATAWPPLTVDSEELPGGLDSSEFSVVERSDGSYQLAANDWPLYTFGGDAAAGDVNGQGVADKWYAVDASGAVLEDVEPGAGASATTAAESGSGSDSDESGY
jgi:predicted lipoprotein with Yx(FWY)xxD motif